MKAYLLAAGLGTRLRPLTNTVPKCMVPIRQKPMLAIWLDLLAKHGVTDVLINTHYLRPTVAEFIKQYNESHTNIRVTEFFEETLLGSAGTLAENKSFVAGEENFLICYADILTNLNITDMVKLHKSHTGHLTMALFHAENPSACGIATLDEKKLITNFIEKPENPTSDLANAGIYVTDQHFFDLIDDTRPQDIGFSVLPKLSGQMYGYETNAYVLDVGTMEKYERAQKEFPED